MKLSKVVEYHIRYTGVWVCIVYVDVLAGVYQMWLKEDPWLRACIDVVQTQFLPDMLKT